MDLSAFKRLAGLIAATTIVAASWWLTLGQTAVADTHGNADNYEGVLDPNHSDYPKSVASDWWSGSTVSVNQRYGCTDLPGEPDQAPQPYCPSPYNYGWHQGVDINLGTGTALYSQVAGTVADFATSCLQVGCSLGYLAIKTLDSHIVYLLHGSPTPTFAQKGHTVNKGDAVYTTGTNGYSTGPHLHFEVHKSVVGELQVPTGPGDDVNPESWLSPVRGGRGSGPESTWGLNRLDFLALNSSGNIDHYWWDWGWGSWQSLGMTAGVVGNAVGISWGPGRYDVFGITGGAIVHRAYDAYGAGWTLQDSPPPPPNTTWADGLAVVSRGPSLLDGFARGADGHYYHFFWNGVVWGEDSMGGNSSPTWSSTADLAVTSWDQNHLDLFARGCVQSTCDLEHLHWGTDTGWQQWTDVGDTPGGSLGPGLSAVSWGGGRLDVFATSSAGGVYHAYSQNPGSFSWDQFDNKPAPDTVKSGWLAATSWGLNRLDLYVVGDGGGVYHTAWGGGPWVPWDSPAGIPNPASPYKMQGPIAATTWD